MVLIPVDSTAIAAVGYEGNTLAIEFHDNPIIYEFPRVPYSVYRELLNADSPGTYYNLYIRGWYG